MQICRIWIKPRIPNMYLDLMTTMHISIDNSCFAYEFSDSIKLLVIIKYTTIIRRSDDGDKED